MSWNCEGSGSDQPTGRAPSERWPLRAEPMHVGGNALHLGDFEGDGPDTFQGRLGALSGFYDHGLDVGAVFGWLRTTTRSACTRGGGLVPPDGEVVVTPITASDRVKRRDRCAGYGDTRESAT